MFVLNLDNLVELVLDTCLCLARRMRRNSVSLVVALFGECSDDFIKASIWSKSVTLSPPFTAEPKLELELGPRQIHVMTKSSKLEQE